MYHLLATKREVGQYIFLAGDPSRIPMISERLADAREVSSSRGFIIHSGMLEGALVSAVSTGIGCPSAAVVMEELIVLGAHTFLRVGTCGSLQPPVKVGDIVISLGAVRDEGTSVQYVPREYPAVADFDLTTQLIASTRQAAVDFHVGITHCKDAFYSELAEYTADPSWTASRWDSWRRARVLATEMEAAAIFTLASLRGCRAGAIFSVVGSTTSGQLITDTSGVKLAVEIGIEAMNRMIRQDVLEANGQERPLFPAQVNL